MYGGVIQGTEVYAGVIEGPFVKPTLRNNDWRYGDLWLGG